jgi:hypothetical protein
MPKLRQPAVPRRESGLIAWTISPAEKLMAGVGNTAHLCGIAPNVGTVNRRWSEVVKVPPELGVNFPREWVSIPSHFFDNRMLVFVSYCFIVC